MEAAAARRRRPGRRARPRAGSVYFGLGTTNFTNAYLLDDKGKAAYDLEDEHGTIQKVSPDFTQARDHRHGHPVPGRPGVQPPRRPLRDRPGGGDLARPTATRSTSCCTSSRGGTTASRRGTRSTCRSVIDEPSVFDYAPQHQSTCGLDFNEPVNGGPTFGPGTWAGDALVTGYSRGKLYRTKLAKTAAGLRRAERTSSPCLNMLPADACVSPRGDLVVAVHSGLPDWGSGPKGKGKLYKIALHRPRCPAAGAGVGLRAAGGPRRVRPAARPWRDCKDLAKEPHIEYGQVRRPRRPVRVAAAAVTRPSAGS